MELIYPPEIKKYNTTEEFKKIFAEFLGKISIEEGNINSYNTIGYINGLLWLNIPNKLYRFRSITNYSILNFLEDKFVCSKAKTFNDPYDSLLYFDIPALIKSVVEANNDKEHNIQGHRKIVEQFKKSGKSMNELPPMLQHLLSFSTEKFKQQYESLDYAKNLEMVTDKINTMLTEHQEMLKKYSFIGCLTENNNCPLMWGHYADSHKGFCLEYDFTNHSDYKRIKTNDIHLYPVHYNEDRYTATEMGSFLISHFMGGMPKLADTLFWFKAFLNKSLNWEYEKEWRVIYNPKQSIDEDYFSIQLKPTAIYYGTKMDRKIKESFRKIAQQKRIKEYDMQLEHNEKKFLLTPQPL